MKRRILTFFLFLLFFPLIVKANIVCNDGTVSATCGDCHQGCCSRHGGCTNNPGSSGNYGTKKSSGSSSSRSSSSKSNKKKNSNDNSKNNKNGGDNTNGNSDSGSPGKGDEDDSSSIWPGIIIVFIVAWLTSGKKNKRR